MHDDASIVCLTLGSELYLNYNAPTTLIKRGELALTSESSLPALLSIPYTLTETV